MFFKDIPRNNLVLLIFILVILFLSTLPLVYSADQSEDGWEMFGKWYEWKIRTQLPIEQKEIIDYFNESEKLNEKVEAIWMEGKGTIHPKPSPEKAIKLIDKILEDFEILHVPKLCKKHYEAEFFSEFDLKPAA